MTTKQEQIAQSCLKLLGNNEVLFNSLPNLPYQINVAILQAVALTDTPDGYDFRVVRAGLRELNGPGYFVDSEPYTLEFLGLSEPTTEGTATMNANQAITIDRAAAIITSAEHFSVYGAEEGSSTTLLMNRAGTDIIATVKTVNGGSPEISTYDITSAELVDGGRYMKLYSATEGDDPIEFDVYVFNLAPVIITA